MIGQNNPFNIRSSFSHWKGQDGETRGFCNFKHIDYGIRVALYLLMRSYRRQGLKTISAIISRFAPISDNNTFNYIYYVSNKTGIAMHRDLKSKMDYFLVLHFMSCMEGSPVSLQQISEVYNKFKSDFDYEKV